MIALPLSHRLNRYDVFLVKINQEIQQFLHRVRLEPLSFLKHAVIALKPHRNMLGICFLPDENKVLSNDRLVYHFQLCPGQKNGIVKKYLFTHQQAIIINKIILAK
jgi:hypothetical protein